MPWQPDNEACHNAILAASAAPTPPTAPGAVPRVNICSCRVTLLLLNLQGAGTLDEYAAALDTTATTSPCESSSSDVLDILNQLYISSSTALQQVDSLVLALPPVSTHTKHKAYAAYQHLFHESGFLGYYNSAGAGAAAAAPASISSRNSSAAVAGPAAATAAAGHSHDKGSPRIGSVVPSTATVVGLTRNHRRVLTTSS